MEIIITKNINNQNYLYWINQNYNEIQNLLHNYEYILKKNNINENFVDKETVNICLPEITSKQSIMMGNFLYHFRNKEIKNDYE